MSRPSALIRATAIAIAAGIALTACSSSTGTSPASDVSSSAAASASVGPEAIPVVVSDPAPALPATVTDADGTTTTVTDISRIVSLSGGVTESLFAMGLGDHVVGRDISSDFPGTEDITLVTNAHEVSAEGVISLRPTLVLADTNIGPPEALDAIRAAGLPLVVVPEVWGLGDVPARNDMLAAAVGLPAAGQALTDYVQDHADGVSVPDKPVVAFLYLRGQAAVYLLGGDGSGADSLLEAIGAVDAGSKEGLGPFTPLTPEALVAAQPDAFLVMTKGLESVGGVDGLLKLPGIAQTPAGKNRRIVTIPDGQLLNFGPRTTATLDQIAAQLSASSSAPTPSPSSTLAS